MPAIINADNGVVSGSVGIKYSSDNSGTLALQTNGNTAVTIDTSQNVGIGTIDPVGISTNYTTLDIRGSSGGGLRMGVGSGTQTYMYSDAGGYNLFTGGAIPVAFGTNNAERMRIDGSTGNVGINTNSPAYRLDVDGTIRVGAGGSSQPLLSRNGTTGGLTINTTAASAGGPLVVQDNGTERMRITSAGNVGIGTNNPTDTLTVNGTVRGQTGLISGPYRTFNASGNYTNGTWYEIANSTNIPAGTWIVNAYVDTYSAGSGIYFNTYSSVPFYIMNTSSNSADTIGIPAMLGSGHAPNGVSPPALRIRLSFQASSDAGKIFVEMNPNANWTGINGTGGKTVIFYLKRLSD